MGWLFRLCALRGERPGKPGRRLWGVSGHFLRCSLDNCQAVVIDCIAVGEKSSTLTTNRKERFMAREITGEEFDRAFDELVEELTVTDILAIPGVVEIVREALNNEVIERIGD